MEMAMEISWASPKWTMGCAVSTTVSLLLMAREMSREDNVFRLVPSKPWCMRASLRPRIKATSWLKVLYTLEKDFNADW